jgi:hypothetical protein
MAKARDQAADLRFGVFFARSIRCESSVFALSNSARRSAVSPRPARLIKNVSIRMPEPGPFGETFFDANDLAIVAASLVNSPGGGKVETVFTVAIHLFFFAPVIARLQRNIVSR